VSSSEVIPFSLSNYLPDPGLQAKGFGTFGVVSKGIPGLAACLDDRFLILEYEQAQETLSEISPKAFDRIELRAVWRQRNRDEVVRDLERVGAMPAGLVEKHGGMLVFRQGLANSARKTDIAGV
jgi:hypothetical protein